MSVDLMPQDVIELRMVTTNVEQTAFNVRHYTVISAPGAGAPLSQCLPLISNTFATHYKNVMGVDARYEGLGGRKIDPLPISVEEYTSQGAGAGTVVGDLMPRQVSALIRLMTNVAGRRGRGRMYVPFPSETSNGIAGTPTAAFNTLIENFADALEVDLVLAPAAGPITLRPCIWSRTARTKVEVVSAAGAQKWATQRRRGSFGRANSNPIPVGA